MLGVLAYPKDLAEWKARAEAAHLNLADWVRTRLWDAYEREAHRNVEAGPTKWREYEDKPLMLPVRAPAEDQATWKNHAAALEMKFAKWVRSRLNMAAYFEATRGAPGAGGARPKAKAPKATKTAKTGRRKASAARA